MRARKMRLLCGFGTKKGPLLWWAREILNGEYFESPESI